MTTPVVSDGPRLVTEIRKVTGSPSSGRRLSAVLRTCRSAPRTVTAAAATLLDGFGSTGTDSIRLATLVIVQPPVPRSAVASISSVAPLDTAKVPTSHSPVPAS